MRSHFGDDFRFDDDDYQQQQFDNGEEVHVTTKTASPLGKRSFDEIDELEDESSEVKKVRSS